MPRTPKDRHGRPSKRFDTQDREFRFDDENRRHRNYSLPRDDENYDYRESHEYKTRRRNTETYDWDPRQAAASEYPAEGPRWAKEEGRQGYQNYSFERRPDVSGVYNYNDGGDTPTAGRSGYRGHGPKGYVRKDERILEDICEKLTVDDRVDASEITVEVVGGIVTLSGTVGSRYEKRISEDIVDTVAGVIDVNNVLTCLPRVSEQILPAPPVTDPLVPAPAALAQDGDLR